MDYQGWTTIGHNREDGSRSASLNICWAFKKNSLVFIWCDMLPQKLLPWFFYLSMFIELHHFGKLTVIGTFWAITHVVIWCYHWIMHKNILTFRIFCEMLLFFTVSMATRWMNYENSSCHTKSFLHIMHLCKNIECQIVINELQYWIAKKVCIIYFSIMLLW